MAQRAVVFVLAVLLLVIAVQSSPISKITSEAQMRSASSGIPPLASAARPWGPGFTANLGQISNPAVKLYFVGGALRVGFAQGEILLAVSSGAAADRGVLVRETFVNANPVSPLGKGKLPYSTNFFNGDPNRSHTNIPSYDEVVYPRLYSGVDLVYTATDSGTKYAFSIAPGADVGLISVRFEGTDALSVDAAGDLLIQTFAGNLIDSAPVANQAGTSVDCGFVLRDPQTVGFQCSGVDASQLLEIDPLIYATFLGGVDNATAVATDSSGNAYVTGSTGSIDFPTTPGAYNTSYAVSDSPYQLCCHSAYVSKLSPDGSSLIYSTFLGGSLYSTGVAISVDTSGDAFVAGSTISPDFPATWGRVPVPRSNYPPIYCSFVVALNPSGSGILYSAIVANSTATALELDANGHAFVAGYTWTGFTTTAGAYNTSAAVPDVFIFELNTAGNGFVYSSAFGGRGIDVPTGLAVDSSGNAYVVGYTNSGDFPTTPGSYHPIPGGTPYLIAGPFLSKLDAGGSALGYSTLLGPDTSSKPAAVDVDATGDAYVTGVTNSTSFPATSGAFQPTFQAYSTNGYNAFVEKVNAAGSALVYATYLGGTVTDYGQAIRVDSTGRAMVTGCTWSPTFPTTPSALDTTFNNPSQGYSDAFLSYLNAPGSGLVASTFLGGSMGDCGNGLSWGPSGGIYVAGSTSSADFPVTLGSFSTTFTGSYTDAFVASLSSLNGTLEYRMTVASDPSGLQMEVNGVTVATPDTFACAEGSSVTLSAVSPQVVQGFFYRFVAWSDGGAQTHSVACTQLATFTASFTSSPVADFVLLASPSRTTTAPGGNATVDMTVLGLNGYAGPVVTLSLIGAPMGVTPSFAPTFVAPSGTAVLTLTVSATVVPGVYPVVIDGSNGTATRSVPFQLEILGLQLSANSTLVSVQAGSLGTTTVNVTMKGNYTAPVVLSVSGLPAGVGVSFSNAQFLATGVATLTFIVAASAQPGTYPMALAAAGAGVTRVVSLSLEILGGGGSVGGPVDLPTLLVWFVGVAAAASAVIYLVERRKR